MWGTKVRALSDSSFQQNKFKNKRQEAETEVALKLFNTKQLKGA